MEYPFKDLLPLDEVLEREGYYRDWTHIDADTFHQISELVKFIREKGHGADTREAMAQALERVYHDAAQSGNANMEVSMARKHFKDLAARLDASDDELTSVTAQLAQKANQLDVFLKSKGININDFDDSTRKAFLEAQGIDVNYVLGDRNVKPRNTTFFKEGKNLFNKATAEEGVRVTATGRVIADSNFLLSDYIRIFSNEEYIKTTGHGYAFYDANKVFISGSENGNTFTTPSNAVYVRINSSVGTVDIQQLELGTVATPYEPYSSKEFIDNKYIEQQPIPFDKLDFLEPSVNLFDKSKAIYGYVINAPTGEAYPTANFYISDYIPVIANQSYTVNYSYHKAFYDADKNYVSGLLATEGATFTVPENAVYLRTSISAPRLDEMIVARGVEVPRYEPFKLVIPKEYLGVADESDEPDIVEKVINLPSVIHSIGGFKTDVYFKNIMNDDNFDFELAGVAGKVTHMDDHFYYVGKSTAETFPLTLNVYDEARQVNSKRITIMNKAKSDTTKDFKAVLIGDSTINSTGRPDNPDGMEDSLVTKQIVNLFESDSYSNIELVGTRGVAPSQHEGRGGWSTQTYLTESSASNPFWNPTTNKFDFAYWATSNDFTGLTNVFINLGINDIFPFSSDLALTNGVPQILNRFDTMIDSIKAYDPNIKIAFMLTVPPSASQNNFGEAYGHVARWRYKRSYDFFVSEMIKKYDNRTAENIHLVPTNIMIDTKTEIRDAVHPFDEGYEKMGEAVYKFLKVVG